MSSTIHSNKVNLFNGISIEGNSGCVEFIHNINTIFKIKDSGQIYLPNINEYSSAGITGPTGLMFFDINSGQIVYSNDKIISNTSNITTTSYGVATNVSASLDNVLVRITIGGIPQVQSGTGSFTACYSGYTCKGGSTFVGYTNTNTIIDNISWTNISSSTLSNAGDTIYVNLQNKSAGKIYRITYYQTSNPPETEAYAISIEKII